MVQYRVIKAVKDLPPRDIYIRQITANPTTIDLVALREMLAFDVLVKNTDTVKGTVQIEDNLTYDVGAGESIEHSDVQITKIIVTGITSGFLIMHVLDLSLLARVQAVEVR